MGLRLSVTGVLPEALASTFARRWDMWFLCVPSTIGYGCVV